MTNVRAVDQGDRIYVYSPYSAKDRCKSIPGARWDRVSRAWTYPLTVHSLRNIRDEFGLEALDERLRAKLAKLEGGGSPIEVNLKNPLWEHQRDAVMFVKDLDGAMLAMDMGTGKTLVAIALMDGWNSRRVAVICPKSVIPVWPSEVEKHSRHEWKVSAETRGSVAKRAKAAARTLYVAERTGQRAMIVVNYEACFRNDMANFLLGRKWDVLVYDEVHHIKSPSGKQSRFCAKLSKMAKKRLGLTGTPMPHSPLDIYGQARAIDPSVFGTYFTSFRARYAVMGGYGGHEILRYQNLDDLNRRFYSFAFRVRKEDVLDLPPTTATTRYCTLSKEEARVYIGLEDDFYAWLDAGEEVTISNALVKLLRLQQCTSGYVNSDNGEMVRLGTSKLDAFSGWLEDLPLREPLVVFCRFVADVEAAAERCVESGRTVSRLYGKMHELEDWQRGKTDVLVTQVQSGSEGVDLSRACQAAYLSVGFSLGRYEQSLARLDRPGQTRSVTYTHFVAENTVDCKVLAALAKRKAVIQSIIGK